jgi:cytochrome c biogenesis protein CcdA
MFFNNINSVQERFFDITIKITYILIVITALGLSQTAPKYLEILDYYVKIYVCLFLVWRFNPFRHINTFTRLDKKIAFSSGIFILTTTFLNNLLTKIPNHYLKNKFNGIF